MIFVDLLVVCLVALFLAMLLAAILGWRHPARPDVDAWPTILFLFIILFLAVWAGGVWLIPFGPQLAGAYWLPFVVVGLAIALILAAASTGSWSCPESMAEAKAQDELATQTGRIFGFFFWLLVVLLSFAVIIAYLG